MEQGLMLILLLVTANLDTLLLSALWHSGGRRITWPEAAVLTVTTSLMTGLALLAGRLGVGLCSPSAGKRLAAALLAGMGIWMLLDWLRKLDDRAQPPPGGEGGIWACMVLGLALGANNSGLGLAAGLAGAPAAGMVAGNGAVTLAALGLGRYLGTRGVSQGLGKWQTPLSGALLIVMGALAGI